MKESNKTYAVKVLNYIRENLVEVDTDLLEEGVARLFSHDNQSFEDNLASVQNWLYAGGNERTNVHTLVAELSGELQTSNIVDGYGEMAYTANNAPFTEKDFIQIGLKQYSKNNNSDNIYHQSGTTTTSRPNFR